jgi:hypothetical protein
MILLLASSAALFIAATLLAHAMPLRGAVQRAVAAAILVQAAITLTLLVAGLVLRSFAPVMLLLLAGAEVVAVLVVLRPTGLRIAAGSVRATVRTGLAGLREALVTPPVLGVCVVAAGLLVWRAILAVRLGVLDYDAFSYHLVTVDMWLQENAIDRIPQRIWSDIYPANGELLTLWLMAFTRNDSLAALTGLVSLPLAVVSTVGLARVLGASRPWAVLAGGLLALTPAVMVLTSTTYVDILAAADLAAAWYLGLLALREAEPRRRTMLLVLAGLAIGLTIGTKQTVLLPAAAMGALLVAAVVARAFPMRRQRAASSTTAANGARGESAVAMPPAPLGAVARDVLAVSLPAAAFGSYWYLRNLLSYGNPFWPFSVGPFAGVGTFGEYLVGSALEFGGAAPVELLVTSWTADFGISRYTFDQRLGGYGLQWLLVLGLATVAVALLVVRARRSGRRRLMELAGALAIVVPVAITLAVTPMSWWARLTLFAVVGALALAAVALSKLPRGIAVILAIVLAAGATWSAGIATATNNLPTDASYRIVSFDRLARLALRGPAARDNLAFWEQCDAFDRIPPGSRVTFDQADLRRVTEGGRPRLVGYGFNLLHLIVGHNLERRLAPPVQPTDDPAELLARARAVGATHIVLVVDQPSAAAARRDPAAFESLGIACDGPLAIVETEIFELVGA